MLCNSYSVVVVRCLQDKSISIWESKNFFMDLDPLPGSVEAVKEMAKMKKYAQISLYHTLKTTSTV